MPRNAGFSLLEVMIAILILGIGLAGLTQGIGTALRSNQEAEEQTRAAQLAAGRIELLRAEGYVSDGETDGEGEQDLAVFRWRQTVSPASIDGLHEVVVAVEKSRSGQLVYELRTLLFDPPLESIPTSTSSASARKDTRDKGRKR